MPDADEPLGILGESRQIRRPLDHNRKTEATDATDVEQTSPDLTQKVSVCVRGKSESKSASRLRKTAWQRLFCHPTPHTSSMHPLLDIRPECQWVGLFAKCEHIWHNPLVHPRFCVCSCTVVHIRTRAHFLTFDCHSTTRHYGRIMPSTHLL